MAIQMERPAGEVVGRERERERERERDESIQCSWRSDYRNGRHRNSRSYQEGHMDVY